VTGGKPGKDLDAADFAKVEKALADAVKAAGENDIPF
jgi:hypothetical protein